MSRDKAKQYISPDRMKVEIYLDDKWVIFIREDAKLDLGEWQLCPKCFGDGNLARYNSPSISSGIPICDVCHGKKIIERPIY